MGLPAAEQRVLDTIEYKLRITDQQLAAAFAAFTRFASDTRIPRPERLTAWRRLITRMRRWRIGLLHGGPPRVPRRPSRPVAIRCVPRRPRRRLRPRSGLSWLTGHAVAEPPARSMGGRCGLRLSRLRAASGARPCARRGPCHPTRRAGRYPSAEATA
jgi:hypothetical protein